MTKPNLASINVILDGSGSMNALVNDTIGGFNQFLQEQQALSGEATLSLCVFNANVRSVYDNMPLANVPILSKKTYRASGRTALLDAIGSTIDGVGKKFASMKEEDRPSKVLFLIITDGEENASHLLNAPTQENLLCNLELLYPLSKIKDMIEHQRSKYNWEFVFIGANVDAFKEGASLGISNNNTLQYAANAAGTANLYKSISTSTARYRDSGSPNSGFFGKDNS